MATARCGILILRYFDDKIGGTIKGFEGFEEPAHPEYNYIGSNRPYRDVNLDGIFSVERTVTIASGAVVNLFGGTALTLSTAGTAHTIYVDGTLNIQTTSGAIRVPVIVRNGGKLIVSTGANVELAAVTVNSGGEYLKNAPKTSTSYPQKKRFIYTLRRLD